MAHYDYALKNQFIQVRDSNCFSDMFNIVHDVNKISIYAFPHGAKKKNGLLGEPVYYGFPDYPKTKFGPLLEKYNTENKLGVELYAEALAFMPGTSFVPEYKELKKTIANGPMCEFRLETTEKIHVSAIMKQMWMNGIRYSWEGKYTRLARFILTYFKPEMSKLERFNLYVLSHNILGNEHAGHASCIRNQKPFTEEKYQLLLNSTKNGFDGTRSLKNEEQRDPETYQLIETKITQAVKKTIVDIENEKPCLTLKELYTIWNEVV